MRDPDETKSILIVPRPVGRTHEPASRLATVFPAYAYGRKGSEPEDGCELNPRTSFGSGL